MFLTAKMSATDVLTPNLQHILKFLTKQKKQHFCSVNDKNENSSLQQEPQFSVLCDDFFMVACLPLCLLLLRSP